MSLRAAGVHAAADHVRHRWRDFPRIRNSRLCSSASTNRTPSVDLAEAGRLPDWRVEFGYGYRREYSDMVMLQVGTDLPMFQRQPSATATLRARAAMDEAAAAQWEDGKRRARSRARWKRVATSSASTSGSRRTNDAIEPQTNVGIEAATAAWRSGRGTLRQVIDARRVRLDVLLARLDLQYDALKRRIELDYLIGGE